MFFMSPFVFLVSLRLISYGNNIFSLSNKFKLNILYLIYCQTLLFLLPFNLFSNQVIICKFKKLLHPPLLIGIIWSNDGLYHL